MLMLMLMLMEGICDDDRRRPPVLVLVGPRDLLQGVEEPRRDRAAVAQAREAVHLLLLLRLARGVAQSKAFRVLQIMTDTEEDAAARCRHAPRQAEEEEEVHRFTGLRDSGSIPSRFFHALQKITGTDEDEDRRTSPIVVADALHQHQHQHQHPSSRPQPPRQASAAGYLRRPAAFLPSKASTSSPPGFRPVRPPCSDGAVGGNHFAPPRAAVGTDF